MKDNNAAFWEALIRGLAPFPDQPKKKSGSKTKIVAGFFMALMVLLWVS
jgi:hypothetical protein